MSQRYVSSLSKVLRSATCAALCIALASCGGGGGSAGSNPNVPPSTTPVAAALTIVFAANSLPSAGAANESVGVTVTATDANNNVINGAKVSIALDSGSIAVSSPTTGANGQVTGTLTTGGDKTNRTIHVTATSGTVTKTASINVVGTKMTVTNSSSALPFNGSDVITVSMVDSDGQAIANAPITATSQAGNTITPTTFSGTAANPLTTSGGTATFTVTAAKNDTITFSSYGTSGTAAFTVATASLALNIVDPVTGQTPTNTYVITGAAPLPPAIQGACNQVTALYTVSNVPTAGTLTLSTSRGTLFTDAACSQAFSGQVALTSAGTMASNVYLSSSTVGTATVTGLIAQGNGAALTQTASTTFTAQLTSSASMTFQASPKAIGANTDPNNPTQNYSTLRVLVTDGPPLYNAISNVAVAFNIVLDSSGGTLSTPAIAITGSNGVATVNFNAGATSTSANGVVLQATLLGINGSSQHISGLPSAQTFVTVTRQAFTIAAGTGNTLTAPTDSQYQQNWSVFVSDATGNPVKGAQVVATLDPVYYQKGSQKFFGTSWAIDPSTTPTSSPCINSDTNRSGIWDPVTSGKIYYPLAGQPNQPDLTQPFKTLVPGIPANVTVGGVTDATGTTVVQLTYPKDRALWTQVTLTFSTTVNGSNAVYTTPLFTLLGLSGDYTNPVVSPPGRVSPYGIHDCDIYN